MYFCVVFFQLTISAHADGYALLEAAILAAIPVDPEDGTLLILGARPVLYLLLDASSEETLRARTTAVRLSVGGGAFGGGGH